MFCKLFCCLFGFYKKKIEIDFITFYYWFPFIFYFFCFVLLVFNDRIMSLISSSDLQDLSLSENFFRDFIYPAVIIDFWISHQIFIEGNDFILAFDFFQRKTIKLITLIKIFLTSDNSKSFKWRQKFLHFDIFGQIPKSWLTDQSHSREEDLIII